MASSFVENNQSLTDNNREKLNQRRKPAPLEINTTPTKTVSFFNTSDNHTTPRPPPSLSRKISIKQQPVTPTSSVISTPIVKEADDGLYHYDSYANRIRNLLSTPIQETTSPIPQHPPHFIDELDSLPTPCNGNPSPFKFPMANQPEIPTNYPTFTSPPLILAEQPALGEDYPIPSMILEPVAESDIIGKQIGDFQLCQLLGFGAFSKVYLAQHTKSNQYFALKAIHKLKLFDEPRVKSSIDREVGILKHIAHPNIVKLETTMETEKMLWIVLEYVEGGELFDAIKTMHHQRRITDSSVCEAKVKEWFLQLLHAVQWLHDHNVVHRDLKLENILIHKGDDKEILKITDFGLARVIDPANPLLVTRCGSEEYAAPEIVRQQSYDGRKSDTWSLGIILYAMLVGYLPFRYDPRKQETVTQLFYRILGADIRWPKDTPVSDNAKHVVQLILKRDPEKRIDIHEIEKLPWFNQSN